MRSYQQITPYLLITPVLAFYLYWGYSPVLGDFGGDNAVYWLTANYWSPYGEARLAAAHFATTSQYPPLYPLLLALAGGGTSVLAAHVITVLVVCAALVGLLRLYRVLGLSPYLSLALVVTVAALRTTLLESLQLHSEHLYLLLSILTLICVLGSAKRPALLYAAAVLVAAAYLTRTSGLALAGAFVLYVFVVQRRALPGCLLIVGVPVVAWSLWHPGSTQYLASMSVIYDRHGLLAQLHDNASHLWLAWQRCFAEPLMSGTTSFLPALIAFAGLCGAVWRAARLQLDGLYVVAYLGMLLTWPYPAEYERMLYPLAPLLLVHGVLAVQWAIPRVVALAPQQVAALFVSCALAAALPFILLVAHRLSQLPDIPGFEPYRRTVAWYYAEGETALLNIGYQRAITEALNDIWTQGRVPPDGCVLAIKPSVTSLYSRRLTYAPPRPTPDPDEYMQRVYRSPCRALFMTQAVSPSFAQAYFPHALVADQIATGRLYSNLLNPHQAVAMLAFIEDADGLTRQGTGSVADPIQ